MSPAARRPGHSSKRFVAAVMSAILACAFSSAGGAFAQSGERLARPFEASRTGPDGKLIVARNATFGSLIVDQYANFSRLVKAKHPDFSAPETDFVAKALKPLMCDGSAGVPAAMVAREWRGLSKSERARLRARDPASLTDFSIRMIAIFDGASADAIRADEAIGPGVYHDAIDGFRIALDVCDLFGQGRGR